MVTLIVMLSRTFAVITLGTALLLTAGCTTQPFSAIAASKTAACRSADATLSPALIYDMMNACVRQQNYDRAVTLYAQAGSYSWYDAAQADSDAARQQHQALLRDALDKLNERQRERLWQQLGERLQEAPARAQVCRQVTALGPPRYPADFMPRGKARTADARLWQRAVNHYLHCAS